MATDVPGWTYRPSLRGRADVYLLADGTGIEWRGYWEAGIDPFVDDMYVVIHHHVDGKRVFVGARNDEELFPPRFFPSVESAVVWIKLVGRFP